MQSMHDLNMNTLRYLKDTRLQGFSPQVVWCLDSALIVQVVGAAHVLRGITAQLLRAEKKHVSVLMQSIICVLLAANSIKRHYKGILIRNGALKGEESLHYHMKYQISSKKTKRDNGVTALVM